MAARTANAAMQAKAGANAAAQSRTKTGVNKKSKGCEAQMIVDKDEETQIDEIRGDRSYTELDAEDGSQINDVVDILHHTSSGISQCRATASIQEVCAFPGREHASYATELKNMAQSRNSKTGLDNISEYRNKLVKAFQQLDDHNMTLLSFLQGSLGTSTSDRLPTDAEDFLRAWDEISHLSAKDVIALKETWTDADTQLLLSLDSSESNGFVDKGPLTTEAFRQRLPSMQDLETLQSRKSWAMVGSGAILNGGGLGSLIDEHEDVVRFNNLVGEALQAKDTGIKTTLHVVNRHVKGQPNVPVFDLEAVMLWDSYCKRVWRHGPFAIPDSPVFIIRPSARCALSDNLGHFSRGFLFYWLFAKEVPRVDMFGFQGDIHFQSPHVSVPYTNGNKIGEPFVKFEHLVYRQASDGNGMGAKQPISLVNFKNVSNLSTVSASTQPKKVQQEEIYTTSHVTNLWLVLTVALFSTVSLATAATQTWSRRSISIAVCSLFLVMTVSADMITTVLAARHGGAFNFNPACMVLLIESSKLVASVLLCAQAVVQANLGQPKGGAPSGAETLVSTQKEQSISFFSRFLWSSIPAFLYAASNIMNYYGIARSKTSQYAVLRETSLIWSACLWRLIFRQPINKWRWFAIWVIMLGCSIKAIPDLISSGTVLDSGILIVLVQAFLSALAGVTNEFVLKKDLDADINSQNVMLYFHGAVFSFTSLVVFHPSRVQSAEAFFNGFEPGCWYVVIVSSLIGLCASRILKYADAVTKGVVVALRGPALMCVSTVVLSSMSVYQSFTIRDLASLMVICPATMMFLLCSNSNQSQLQPEPKSEQRSTGPVASSSDENP